MTDSNGLPRSGPSNGSSNQDTGPTKENSPEPSLSKEARSNSQRGGGATAGLEEDGDLAPVPEGSLLLGSDLQVTSVDQSFQELLGVLPEKIEGRPVFEIEGGVFDLPQLRALLEEASEGRATDDLTIERDFGPLGHCELRFEARSFARPDLTLFTVKDLTLRRQHQQLADEQARLMELIASEAPLQECLSALCEAVPRLSDGARASVLLADEERDHFTQNVAPDLGSSFGEGLEGAPINDLCIGTCGEAVFSGERVVSTDIEHDETWSKEWRQLCVTHGIRACFSAPIWDADGEEPQGSFMLCFGEARAASKWERRLADFGTRIASIALEREESRKALRERKAQLEADLANYRLLQHASTELLREDRIDALHEKILDTAVDITDADFGSIQKIDTDQEGLELLAHRGFTPEAAAFWKRVDLESCSTCGKALEIGQRVVVPDIKTCSYMSGSKDKDMYLETGIRAVQTTPLFSRSGDIVGMISTHWNEPHEPSERDLHLMDVLARQAADLLEQKRTEEALRASEKRLRLATEAAELGVFEWDVSNDEVSWENDRMYEIFRFPRDEEPINAAKFANEVAHPDDAGDFEAAVQEALQSGQFYFVGRFHRRDGALGWIELTGQIQRGPDGTPSKMHGIAADITEQKKTEERLRNLNETLEARAQEARREQERLQSLLDSIPDEVWFCDESGHISLVNETAAQRFGFESLEDVHRPLEEIQLELDVYQSDGTPRPKKEAPLFRSLDGEVVEGEEELLYYPETGEKRHRQVNSAPLRDQSGEITGAVAVVRDITGLKRTEKKLRQRERDFTTLANNIPQLAWMADPDGHIFWYNERWYEYTGTTFEEMEGWGWKKVHHPDHLDRVVERYKEALESEEPFEDTFPLQGKDGEYQWFLTRAMPIRDEKGQVVRWFGTNTDITDRLELEEKLKEINETLEDRVEERTRQVRELTSRVTLAEQRERERIGRLLHDDLQQRLYGSKLQITSLQESLQEDGQEGFADEAEAIEGRVEEVIQSLRNLSVGMSPPVLKREGLTAALEWLQSHMAKTRGLSVKLEAEEEFQLRQEMRVLLFQVVRELLSNVDEHAGTREAFVGLWEEEESLLIQVSDEGKGFDPGTLESLDPEEGFGLSAARERLRLFGGGLEVQATQGEGTEVTIRMPLEKSPEVSSDVLSGTRLSGNRPYGNNRSAENRETKSGETEDGETKGGEAEKGGNEGGSEEERS